MSLLGGIGRSKLTGTFKTSTENLKRVSDKHKVSSKAKSAEAEEHRRDNENKKRSW